MAKVLRQDFEGQPYHAKWKMLFYLVKWLSSGFGWKVVKIVKFLLLLFCFFDCLPMELHNRYCSWNPKTFKKEFLNKNTYLYCGYSECRKENRVHGELLGQHWLAVHFLLPLQKLKLAGSWKSSRHGKYIKGWIFSSRFSKFVPIMFSPS